MYFLEQILKVKCHMMTHLWLFHDSLATWSMRRLVTNIYCTLTVKYNKCISAWTEIGLNIFVFQ